MAAVKFYNGERVDLLDLQQVASGYPKALQAALFRLAFGVGVLDGFRVLVLPQAGSTKGQIEVFNGVGADHQGIFINNETGTRSQRIQLPAPNTEYWIEVEFQNVDAFPDSRAFWDATVDNADPIPDGAEVTIARTYTRSLPTWRVVQPIQNNVAEARTSGSYAPIFFRESNTLTLPLCVIRTNASGQVSSGNPDTDATGNDLVSVSNAEGVQTWVKFPSYGESEHTDGGGFAKVQGRNTTDQRPRLFEPLLPPYLAPFGEALGDAVSDYWIRDVKSAFDHLAHAIGQIKYGAGESTVNTGEADFGQFYEVNVSFVDPVLRYIETNAIFANQAKSAGLPTTTTVQPQQLVGCTLQFTGGSWSGFYAQVRGNTRTDGGGITRIYLGSQSHLPTWRALPATAFTGRVVQHRQNNWLSRPTPDSNFRGLNALDSEVVSARTDLHSGRVFSFLTNRINAGKRSRLVLSPVDVRGANGELVNQLPADEASSIALQKAAISDVITSRRGGEILFRAGTYTLDSLLPSSLGYVVSSANSLQIRGEGRENTILQFGVSDANPQHFVFQCASGQDVLLENMTIQGTGTLLRFQGARRVTLRNVKVESVFYDLTTPSIDLGDAQHFLIENCELILSGGGLVASSFQHSVLRNNRIVSRTLSPVQQDVLLDLGQVRFSKIEGNYIESYPATAVLRCSQSNDSTFLNNVFNAFVPDTSTGATFLVSNASSFQRNVIQGNRFNPPTGIGGFSRYGIKAVGAKQCQIINNYFDSHKNAIAVNVAGSGTNAEGCIIQGNRIVGNGGEYGIYAERSLYSVISDNSIRGYTHGLYGAYSQESTFANNVASQCTNFGFQFSDGGAAASGLTDCNVVGNTVKDAASVGFDLRSCNRTHASGNSVKGVTPTPYVLGGSTKLTGGQLHSVGVALAGPVAGFTDDFDAVNTIYVAPYNTYQP